MKIRVDTDRIRVAPMSESVSQSVSHPCRNPCRNPCRSLFVGNYHSFAIRVGIRVAIRVAPVSHPCRTRVADYGRFQDNDFVLKVVKALS